MPEKPTEKLHDKDIREPLFEYLEEQFGRIRIIEEKRMGRSRADVIMVAENAVCGIEIKSDADTYTRLATQVKDYDSFFDYNIAAVGASHANHIEEHIPEYWGIITIEETDEGPDFYMLRKPQPNPNASLKNKLSILWRPELVRIQEKNLMPRYAEKSKQFVRDKILEMVPADKLHAQISEQLFERDYTRIADEINAFRAAAGLHKRRKTKRRARRKPK